MTNKKITELDDSVVDDDTVGYIDFSKREEPIIAILNKIFNDIKEIKDHLGLI